MFYIAAQQEFLNQQLHAQTFNKKIIPFNMQVYLPNGWITSCLEQSYNIMFGAIIFNTKVLDNCTTRTFKSAVVCLNIQ